MMKRTASRFLILLALSCLSCARAGRPVTEVPGPALPVSARVNSVDLLIDEQGTFHVVCYCQVMNSNAGSAPGDHDEWWYLRGRNHGATWDPPHVFRAIWDGHPRLFRVRDQLRILYSDRTLVQITSDDHGVSWSDPRPVLVNEPRRPLDFDALQIGDSLALAFVMARGFGDSLDLCYASLDNSGQGASRCLATVPADSASRPGSVLRPTDPASPQLIADRGSIIAVYPLNWLLTGPDAEFPNTSVTRSDSWIESFRTIDSGAHWTHEERTVPGQTFRGHLSPLPITWVEAVGTNPACLIIDAIPVMRANRTNIGWTTPVWTLERAGVSQGRRRTIAACSAGGRSWVAWIDYRHRRSDQSLLNPFGGGWPFNNPEWVNNDVYVGRVPDHDDHWLEHSARRLTPDLSFSSSLAIQPDGKQVVVMWSGRRRVGKYEGTGDSSPPGILWTSIPVN